MKRMAFRPAWADLHRGLLIVIAVVSLLTSPAHGRCEDSNLTARVLDVVNAEELVVSKPDGSRMKVLLASISAPRLNQPQGKRARDYLAKQILGKEVDLSTPAPAEDSRGSQRWQVRCNGTHMQEELVENGFAWVDNRYSRDTKLSNMQEEARARRAGMWIDTKVRPPWEQTASEKLNTQFLQEQRNRQRKTYVDRF